MKHTHPQSAIVPMIQREYGVLMTYAPGLTMSNLYHRKNGGRLGMTRLLVTAPLPIAVGSGSRSEMSSS